MRIALVSDFFYPNLGGIETHILSLAKEFMKLGHHVIIITHKYNRKEQKYVGIMYLNNRKTENNNIELHFGNHTNSKTNQYLKVYYLNVLCINFNSSFSSAIGNQKIITDVLISERIEITHGHGTTSNLSSECIFHAKTLNIKTLLTEHSIFEEGGFENVLMNKMAKLISIDTDKYISVSFTAKENLMQRLDLESNMIHVIPNAFCSETFFPKIKEIHITRKESSSSKDKVERKFIKIIFISRFVSRKGIDILIRILPLICQIDPNIRVLIGGTGPKQCDIEQSIDKYSLNDQVQLLGELSKEQVAETLSQGDIFLNTSLTEAFCIAILEAAACGLQIVSTNVGGVHEVLPKEMIFLTSIEDKEILRALKKAYKKVLVNDHEKIQGYKKLKKIYNWATVAKETIKVYESIPNKKTNLISRIQDLKEPCDFLWGLVLILEYMVFFLFKRKAVKK